MKRILALVLVFTLFCTAAFATGQEKKQTMDDVVTYAKSVAAMIAYTADDPVSGAVEEVEIGGKKVKVHSEFKYAMDVYYAFYKDYFECLGSMDLSSLTKMATLAEEAEKLDVVMEKINEMDLSDGDMAYYMEVYSEILKLMGGDFSSSTPSSSTGGDDFGLDDLNDLLNGFGF
ncbi:MAG: hypothetical protein QM308_10855 [Bacillota bacterium]|nr:hypothetical protein [Bacillota bacterium]